MAITLKQQRARDQVVIQEAISDADLSKLSDTYTQIDQVLAGLSPQGRQALSSIDGAIKKAQQNIQQVASTSGPAVPDALVSKTISQLVLMQSIIVQVFQKLPQILNVVKRGLDKHLTGDPMPESITLHGQYLVENLEKMSLQEVFLMLEKSGDLDPGSRTYGEKTSDVAVPGQHNLGDLENPPREKEKTDDKGTKISDVVKRVYEQAKKTIAKDMSQKEFYANVFKPAAEALDIKIGNITNYITDEQVNVITDKIFQTQRPGDRQRKKSQEGELLPQQGEPDENSTIEAHLGDSAEAAKALIKNAMKPKGFFNQLKSALKGEGLPFGLDPDGFAAGILSLPFKDFTRLVDNAKGIKILMDPSAAKDVAKTTRSAETGAETGGDQKSYSISKLSAAMDKRGMPTDIKSQVTKFFGTLVGKGPIEFSK